MRTAGVTIGVVLVAARPAAATYSVVATDSSTREVGGVGASCVGALSVSVIYGSVPGHGAMHAQARLGTRGHDEAVRRLGLDDDPDAIIAAITDPGFDPMAPSRQYGVVDLAGRAAGFTGAMTLAYAEDRQGALGAMTYSVQGNILTSAAVLDQTIAALAVGCDLPDRLMHAIEAGAANGEGDRRCTPGGIPADSAFLQVDRDGEPAGSYLRLDVTDTAPDDAIALLRAQYDAWRGLHPCPAPMTPDAGPDGDTDDDGGCGCATSAPSAPSTALWLAVLGFLARRSRRA